MRAGDGGQRLGGGLDADAVGADRALLDQPVQRVVGGVVVDRRARRAVQLHEVEGVDGEVAAGPVGPRAEVLERVVLRHLVDPAAHLRGHGQALVVAQEAADDLLAAAVAIDVGGVEEGDAGLDRGLQHGGGVALAHRAPVGAELPGAEADDGGGPLGAAGGGDQGALLHARSLSGGP